MAAPEVEVLHEPTPAEEPEAPFAPPLPPNEERIETAGELREDWPSAPAERVPELELVSAAAAAAVPAPLPTEGLLQVEDALPPDAASISPASETQPAVPQLPSLAGDPFLAASLGQTRAREYNLEGIPEPEPVYETGPNWMLAFVSAWAGGTALYEAWLLTAPVVRMAVVLSPAFLGYGTLGLGMLGFAAEAMRPAKGPLTTRVALLLPAALTLIGMALLLLSHTPGRRI